MSYILEALRRADAERERGAVPGLHSRPVGSTVPAAAGARPLATWAIGVGAGLAVVVVAVVAWRLSAPAPAPAVVLASGAAAPTAPQAPAPVPAPVPTASVAVPPSAPVAASAPEPAAASRSAVAPPMPPALPRPVPAAPPADRKVAAVNVAPATTASAAPAAAPTAAPPPRVYTPQELPADVQAQLPRLNVSGATYSSNPAYRMVIISGQVLHEGEQAATGTVLEKIEPHAVVLAFKGYRYTLPY